MERPWKIMPIETDTWGLTDSPPITRSLGTAAKRREKATCDTGTSFVAAIRRCIFWQFPSQGVSWKEMTRGEVYTAVVKPLAGVETYQMSQNVKSMYTP